jgi:mono/diheme cytochrome c family protein
MASAAAFVWAVRDQPRTGEPDGPAPPAGAALFSQRCGDCHRAEELRALVSRGATRAEWDAFLPGHTDASEEEWRAILDYLFAPPER